MALLPAVPRTDSNVIRVICGPTSGRSRSEREDACSGNMQLRVMIEECVFHASQFEFAIGGSWHGGGMVEES